MSIRYLTPVVSILPPGGTNYDKFGGTVVVPPFTDSRDISIADIVYEDFTSGLPAPATSAWCYSYYWNAIILLGITSLENFKLFASRPNRYNFGHVSLSDKFAVESDYLLNYEQQRLPLRRAHFFEGEPNPGNLIPDFTPPLSGSTFTYQTIANAAGSTTGYVPRANSIGIFNPSALEILVVINYYAALVFDAYTIATSTPSAVIGVFP